MSGATGGDPGSGGNGPGEAVEARYRDAVACHGTGELERAQGLYEGILAEQPDHADTLHMLGVLAHQQGRNDDAKRLIGDAIAVNDRVDFFHNNLGEIMRVTGEPARAAECFRAAIALAPDNAQAHNNLGVVLFPLGEPEEALQEFESSIRIDPNNAGVHNNMGVVLQAVGRLDDAIASFRRSLELSPQQAEVCNNLGAALHAAGEADEAERLLLAAAGIDPSVSNVHYNLSRLYVDQGRLDAAVASARKAIELNPRHPDYFIALAAAQRARGELEESLSSLRAAVAINAGHPMALNDMGVCLLVMGRFEEAESSLRRALDADPYLAIAHENLARARRFDHLDDKQIEVLESLTTATHQDNQEKAHLHFALGKMLDDVGEHDRAIKHFASGNALESKRMQFDADAGRSFVERSCTTFDAAFFDDRRSMGNTADEPTFIIGMLRSGTTLVEQILASHPKVYAAGELEYFRNVSHQLQERLGGQPYPENLRGIDAGTIESIAMGYLERLRRDMGEARRFTDKNPLNFLHLGLIMTVFPNARVIHCHRDPLDVCLSIYFQHFAEQHDFAYDFADIAEFHQQYEQLMAHWKSVFPGRIHDVGYEALVENLERETRSLLEFLDLEWDESCLAFHRTQREVGTASHWQVRQPLYTRSVGRWRHYDAHLGELRAALGSRHG